MLQAIRDIIRRAGFVGALVLTMVFALPAFEAHACADELPSATASASADLPANDCPDCGPACANGCCHAPHSATTPEPLVAPDAPAFAAPSVWSHVTGDPLGRPRGPDRPPRA